MKKNNHENISKNGIFSWLVRGAIVLGALSQKIRVKYDGGFSPRRSYVEQVPFWTAVTAGILMIKDDNSDQRNLLRYVSKKRVKISPDSKEMETHLQVYILS